MSTCVSGSSRQGPRMGTPTFNRLLRKQRYRCAFCGRTIYRSIMACLKSSYAVVDKIDIYAGDGEDNVVIVCRRCRNERRKKRQGSDER